MGTGGDSSLIKGQEPMTLGVPHGCNSHCQKTEHMA